MSMHKGFTLIEMIFVMSIICLTYLFNLSYKQPKIKDQDINNIICSKLYYAKMHAITYKEKTTISFNSNNLEISSDSLNIEYQLPDNYSFDSYSFTYNQYGRIKTAKSVKLNASDLIYYYKFQLGTGTFYVQT